MIIIITLSQSAVTNNVLKNGEILLEHRTYTTIKSNRGKMALEIAKNEDIKNLLTHKIS